MFEVVIQKKTQETPNISSFELVREDGGKLPVFETGSHIDVHLGENLLRHYSLINHPQAEAFYKIAVLKDANSRGGSIRMHNELAVGDKLIISEPRNLFPLNVQSKKVLLFAGGIGITPIMSMAIELDSHGIDFELHYRTRSKSETAFYQQLSTCSFASKVFFSFSDEEENNTATINQALKNFTENTHLYTCGPVGYMDYIFDIAKSHSWNEQNLHKEIFKVEPKESHTGDIPFKLILSRSGLEIDVASDQTALEAIEDAGVEIDMSCEMGICGACLTAVTDGVPDHRDEFLSSEEKAKNDQFTPCCSRALTSTLTIDL
ncbi:PDR/VanB family oxidoreductase [Alteromonas sp. CI.11.F.A3]|uniref:PDR/VanB family oxidoreductase n=1 Tax=unclassified Alteromonas TaxID=2614992 RepID=UPI001B3A39ED|nr:MULTISPECIES: PDR/VanB family oxidoreductase [unclassified Alteromonas]MBQ4828433.1 oxidoreductase [Alteromonas sp. MMG017]WOI36363.1 PDR/VanB family oxidoreductase [Alteromonas sp. CI.11.F.A3]